MTEAESELASVMAHEIAHVTQRHLYRAYEASSRLSIPTMAATLAAILLGTQNPAMGQAAIMAIQAGAVQFQIDFTRENEAEADRVGMQTLAASTAYDPRSMATFFERLQQATRFYGKNVPEFLRTHPVTTSRISDTRSRADNYPYKQYPDSMAYQLVKAKLRVLSTNNPSDAAAFFQAALQQGTAEQRVVSRYGLALSWLAQQKFKEAENAFQALVSEFPQQENYAIALARTALEAKNFDLALTRYNKLLNQFPNNEAIKLEYIGALLKTNHAEQARVALTELSSSTQRLAIYWEMLAQTYGQLGQPAESHRYLAEYYYVMGHVRDAILQIRLAQKTRRVNAQLAAILAERLTFFINQEQIMSQRQ
jgi:predicted Zn-dependent protease